MEQLTDSSGSANVNFLGHGYVSMGYLGMYIEGAVLAILLALIAGCVHDMPVGLGVGLFAMPAVAVSESSIFVALLTHGAIAALVWSRLLPLEYLGDASTPPQVNGSLIVGGEPGWRG
jgi:hypothetical protein